MEISKSAKSNHNTFGGKIYLSDFDTAYCDGNSAQRIASDWKFDEQCRKFIKSREKIERG